MGDVEQLEETYSLRRGPFRVDGNWERPCPTVMVLDRSEKMTRSKIASHYPPLS
jgi:hypothetical protein